MLEALTYTYEQADAWVVSGARLLRGTGRRSDCAVARAVNAQKILPLSCAPNVPIFI